MALSRASTTRILNTVAAGARQTRQLHLTGSANLPIRTAALDRSPLGLSAIGSESELVDRLSQRSVRQFSTSDSSYDAPLSSETTSISADRISFPRVSTSTPFTPTNQSRHFNTSREMKAVGDTSTIDFAYMPIFPEPSADIEFEDIRVPLLPHISRADGTKAPMASEVSDIAAAPLEVSVVSAESTHLDGGPTSMNGASDSAQDVDFQGAAKQLALGLEREGGEEVRKAKGIVKQVWTGFVDDLFGQKQQKQ